MFKIVRNKWILFVLFILAFVLINMQVRNVSLSERGIVLGIGIDKEADEYVVTCEILAPSNLGAENYQKNRLLVVERGATLDEACERMDKALGVRVSLRHTVLIVLGESLLKAGEYGPLLELFVGNDVSHNTYIVGVTGKAKELFKAKPPLYSTISYKIAETFRSPDIESGMVDVNVKDFFKDYLSESHAMYIPIVEVGKDSMSESSGSGEDEKTDALIFGKIAILDRDGQKLILADRESDGISFLLSNVNEANFFVPYGDKGFDMEIIETTSSRHFDIASNTFTVDIKMWVKMGYPKSDLPSDYIVPFGEEERELAGEIVANAVKSAYLKCHAKGVDILGIADKYYKKMGKGYKEQIGADYLDSVNVKVDVSLIVK